MAEWLLMIRSGWTNEIYLPQTGRSSKDKNIYYYKTVLKSWYSNTITIRILKKVTCAILEMKYSVRLNKDLD